MFKIILLLFFGLINISSVFAQEVIQNNSQSNQPIAVESLTTSAETPVPVLSYDDKIFQVQQDIFNNALTFNGVFLTIAVAIILTAFGLIYLFNLRPLHEKLREQEKLLDKNEKDLQNKTDSLEKMIELKSKELSGEFVTLTLESEKKVGEFLNFLRDDFKKNSAIAEDKIKEIGKMTEDMRLKSDELERKFKVEELKNLWNDHYLWDTRKIYANTLAVLTDCIKKSCEYKNYSFVDLCLGSVMDTLEKPLHLEDNDGKIYHEELVGALALLKGYDKEKEAVLVKAKERLLIKPVMVKNK